MMNKYNLLSTHLTLDKKNINITAREINVLSARTYLCENGYRGTQKEIAELLCSNKVYEKIKESSVKQIVRDLKNKLGIQGNIADIIYALKSTNVSIPEFVVDKTK